ncbi:phosphate-binding protein PstS 1 [Acidocella aquatica]|uniref:Phosphate-binding protein PstS n=1 Tax=Acidocella aquatica TaxID=1922313 RepID=A0ABQ6AB49_9PROT|nr:phosphate ABC transporter substrate-binding protein PstS [Acidocella aquatica]GLR68798.1 phosphate-binding protein PstS 1 [Acidocella aquatica]
MKFSTTLRRTGVAALAIASLAGFTGQAHAQVDVPLVESGSSLLYPLFNLWVAGYTADHPSADITTTSTGSGAGIAQSIKGLINIGASDAYLSDTVVKKNPTMLSIPLAISSQAINYNLPGITNLKLSGPILAGIYEGKITQWNDPAIAAANPGVNLPGHVIIPVHRLDGSGDTFIFTQYLSASDAGWGSTIKFGTAVSWPAVSGGIGANGNSGMVTAAAANPYSIAYIGVSFADQAAKAGLGAAELKNKAGNYVLPTEDTISEAASSVANSTPADERVSIVYSAGANAYPIVIYEYAIVNSSQKAPAVAEAIRTFLSWAITEGNDQSYLKQVHFLPLPATVQALSAAQINKIQ